MPAPFRAIAGAALVATAISCSNGNEPTASKTPSSTITLNPCVSASNVQLTVTQSTVIDCSNGGTTVTFAGNGASYLIVPEFATDQAANQWVSYSMSTGTAAAASLSASRVSALLAPPRTSAQGGTLPAFRPRAAQFEAERVLRERERARLASGTLRASILRQPVTTNRAAIVAPPDTGTIRSFHVASSFTANTWKTVGARLSFVGPNVLVYVDTLAPANGFTPAQFASFGQLFDQTMYPIDTTAFGVPSDIDQNGRVIMLMSPVVNADTPTSQCTANGFVAGFFDTADFDGPADPNSNQGEVFYAIVPDPAGQYSCAHSVTELGSFIPATFLHEFQHLINFSQHVVVSAGAPGASWLDEGLSIVAEELGSLYYEQKCPPPTCRTSASQIFPDSSQGFVQDFLYDSYQYALLPDTASITLGDDGLNGFSWRGGTWLLARWLGDQVGTGVFRKLVRGPSGGVADIELATGQSFKSLFANFGLSLYTDSLPGLARNTAPATLRFASRNVKQLWARLFATSQGSTAVPRADPLVLFPVTTDTSTNVMSPGTTTYFRLDTPSTAATVTIRFSAPLGVALSSSLHPQMGVFRLPPGQ